MLCANVDTIPLLSYAGGVHTRIGCFRRTVPYMCTRVQLLLQEGTEKEERENTCRKRKVTFLVGFCFDPWLCAGRRDVSELVAVVALWSHHGHWALGRNVAEFTAVEALSAPAGGSWRLCLWVFWLCAISRLVADFAAVPACLAGCTWFGLDDGGGLACVLRAVSFVVANFAAQMAGLSVGVRAVVLWAVTLQVADFAADVACPVCLWCYCAVVLRTVTLQVLSGLADVACSGSCLGHDENKDSWR